MANFIKFDVNPLVLKKILSKQIIYCHKCGGSILETDKVICKTYHSEKSSLMIHSTCMEDLK